MNQPEELELIFSVEPDLEGGAFVASWDDPSGGGITTQAATLPELAVALKEAVFCHFGDAKRPAPSRACLHFSDAELQLV